MRSLHSAKTSPSFHPFYGDLTKISEGLPYHHDQVTGKKIKQTRPFIPQTDEALRREMGKVCLQDGIPLRGATRAYS